MPRLLRLKRKRTRVPVGDLNERVFIEDREQKAPVFGAVDATFAFTPAPAATEVWALVQTTSGRDVFDGVDRVRKITHRVVMRSLTGITAETWLRLQDGTRLDIVEVAGGEFIEALCEATGADTKQVAAR